MIREIVVVLYKLDLSGGFFISSVGLPSLNSAKWISLPAHFIVYIGNKFKEHLEIT
jgi:hypothetical protein